MGSTRNWSSKPPLSFVCSAESLCVTLSLICPTHHSHAPQSRQHEHRSGTQTQYHAVHLQIVLRHPCVVVEWTVCVEMRIKRGVCLLFFSGGGGGGASFSLCSFFRFVHDHPPTSHSHAALPARRNNRMSRNAAESVSYMKKWVILLHRERLSVDFVNFFVDCF